ncbi:MAG: YtxH domain-containing protein [Lysinibacillus sp.]|nr:YtxH domain-containing protein [Lysinibacillus sp.]
MSESKLCKAVVAGAIVGAAVSMFDRKTREHTIATTIKVKDTVVYYAKNRDELQNLINEKLEKAQRLYESVSENVQYIVEKIDEVKEIPGTVQTLVAETKEAFSNKEETN